MMKLTWLLVLLFAMPVHAEDPLRVSVAASLREVMSDIGRMYQNATGIKAELNLGASGALAAQIRNGAPVDVFIAASEKDVEQLDQPGTKRTVAGNQLVLIAPVDANWEAGFEMLKNEDVKRIAIGEPRSVPAGQYAMHAIEKLGLLESIKAKLVYGAHVRQVLDYVSRGEVQAGMVYATDAKEAGDKVKVVARATEDQTGPIHYVGVVVKDSAHTEQARRFLDFVAGEKCKAIWRERGFVVDIPSTAQAGAK